MRACGFLLCMFAVHHVDTLHDVLMVFPCDIDVDLQKALGVAFLISFCLTGVIFISLKHIKKSSHKTIKKQTNNKLMFWGLVVPLLVIVAFIVWCMSSHELKTASSETSLRASAENQCDGQNVVALQTINSMTTELQATNNLLSSVNAVCGGDATSADRYEMRSDALRAISRRRDLAADDIAALMANVASTGGTLRAEREAALKNDVLNLLRNQRPPPSGLADALIGIFENGDRDPTLLDYCLQHLGAFRHDVADVHVNARIQRVLESAAESIAEPCAGTALYALADAKNPTASQNARLRRLTLAACGEKASPQTRIAAIQLAGERGYREVLPLVRGILCGRRRDAVTDLVAVGALGLIGDANDLALLGRLRLSGGQRLRTAVETADSRIRGRIAAKEAK